jgi:DNA-binding NarL/FixJ family response regulator
VIKVILVDDHHMIRQGLRMLLERQEDMAVVGEASNGREAIDVVEQVSADVVVMDVNLPELNGLDATRRVKLLHDQIKVVCLSANCDEQSASESLRAGASAFVCKDSAFEELTTAIRSVMRDEVYLSPSVAGVVLQDYLNRSPDASRVTSILSLREREVLQLISEGRTTKEIAYRLHVSVKTIETHRRNVMEKLKIDNVAELTKLAVREGITSL